MQSALRFAGLIVLAWLALPQGVCLCDVLMMEHEHHVGNNNGEPCSCQSGVELAKSPSPTEHAQQALIGVHLPGDGFRELTATVRKAPQAIGSPPATPPPLYQLHCCYQI